MTEARLNFHVLDVLGKLRIEDARLRSWVVRELKDDRMAGRVESEEARKLVAARRAADAMLSMCLMDEMDGETFKRKNWELPGRIAHLQLAADTSEKDDAENRDLALTAFEHSQAIAEKWVSADSLTKRHLLRIVCLNSRLEGESLAFTVRKPFGPLANGAILKNGRGERTGIEFFCRSVERSSIDFAVDGLSGARCSGAQMWISPSETCKRVEDRLPTPSVLITDCNSPTSLRR